MIVRSRFVPTETRGSTDMRFRFLKKLFMSDNDGVTNLLMISCDKRHNVTLAKSLIGLRFLILDFELVFLEMFYT